VIVVDASAAVLGLLADGEARRWLRAEPLAAPHLVDAEVLHTLNRQTRRGVIDTGGAERAWRTWRQLGLRRFPVVGMLDRMWELRHNVTSYDAGYIALAEELDCPLVTADARLANASGPRCTFTVVRR
jgi:predicted nucleic acid-binding protein